MIRSKGEAGTGNVVEATRHMRRSAPRSAGSTTLDEAELYAAAKELRAPYELVARGRRDRQAAGRAVHRRRHRHPGRRGDDDAARRRGRVRRLRHLQVRRPGQARRGDRQGHHVPRRPRRHREGLPRARRGDGRHQHRRARAEPSGSPAAAGEPPRRSASSPCRATSASTSRRWTVRAPTRSPVRRPAELDQVDGLVLPGGESTTIVKLARRVRPARAAAQARSPTGMPAYGSCAGMILLADRVLDGRPGQQTFGGIDVTVRRNAFGRQVDSFETDLHIAGRRRRPRARGLHPRALGREVGAGRRGARDGVEDGAAAGRIVAVRQGDLLATSFHPELTGDARVHALFVEMREGSDTHERPLQVGDDEAQEGRRSTPSAASCSPS